MELVLWVAAGAAIGWLAFAKMGLNEYRGMIVSIILGATGGVIGGKLVAPMFGAVAAIPGEFSIAGLLVVMTSALACLLLGNLVHSRFGV
jgi:uncharacterized membrane protein YeaQ/YmgE (transglycosylase-associated protein family)